MSLLQLAAAGTNLFEGALNSWLGHEEAQNAQAFAERMASTQYQRTVADLKAAGLNPMLAYMNTNASPSVASAGNGSFGGTGAGIISAHSAKAAAHLADEQAKLPTAQRKLIDEQAMQAWSAAKLNTDLGVKAVEDAKQAQAQTALIKQQEQKVAAETKSAEAQAGFDQLIGGAAAAVGPGVTGGAAILNKLLDVFSRRK